MLNADTPVPNVIPTWATYGDMFRDLLVTAASRIAPEIEIRSTNYDTQKFEYPESLDDLDAVLVTGSASSSYEDKAWIERLHDFVEKVYRNHPNIKIFGSCFGHQLVCGGLLQQYGVRVEKDPNGWELGVEKVELNDAFRNMFDAAPKVVTKATPESFRVQFVHADHVVIPNPNTLPNTWVVVGSTPHCAVQGVYEPGRVFTLQGHFEFNRFVNSEILKVFGAFWKPEVLQATLDAIDADDDAEVIAEMVLQFMLERTATVTNGMNQVAGGLLTPPLDE